MNRTALRLLARQVVQGAGLVAAGAGAGAGTVVLTKVASDDARGVIRAHLVEYPDPACLAAGPANVDTAGKFYLPSTKETRAQLRAESALDSLFAHKCVLTDLRIDTLPAAPDTVAVPDTSVQPDTLPTPPVDTTPAPPPPPPAPVDTSAVFLARIGPTLTPDSAAALGGGWALFDPMWTKWEAARWLADSSQWAGNYYDRAQIYFAQWIRTGNPLYRHRGEAIALDYRRKYLTPNKGATSPHWSQLDGLALHYWLTGDDSSRFEVGRAAWNLSPTVTWPRNGNYTDGRQQGRALTGLLLAWQLNAPGAPAGGWAATLDKGLDAILPQQSADGAWRYPVNTCDLSLNYMGAILADALIRVYTHYRPDPRILPAVKRTGDFLWTQWRPNDAVPSFNYYEKACVNQHGSAGPTATPDLTGLYVSLFAWLAGQDPAYRAKADAVALSTMRGLYPQGSKQFNQGFTYFWRALGYLEGWQ